MNWRAFIKIASVFLVISALTAGIFWLAKNRVSPAVSISSASSVEMRTSFLGLMFRMVTELFK